VNCRPAAATLAITAALAAIAIGAPGCGSDSGDQQATGPAATTGSTGGATPTEPGAGAKVCTEIGCESGLFANLSGLRRSKPSISKVEICLGSSCETFTRDEFADANVVNRRLKGQGLRRVKLVGYDESGSVVLRDSVGAPSVRSQPNGSGCSPVCFQVQVRVDPEGRLVR